MLCRRWGCGLSKWEMGQCSAQMSNLKPIKNPAASTHVTVAPMEITASTGTSALRVTRTSTK